MPANIHKSIFINAPRAHVWTYISDGQKFADWMTPTEGSPGKPGEAFAFVIEPQEGSDWCGRIDCKVLERVEGEMIAFTWTDNTFDYKETIVAIRLSDEGEGTRLVLDHTGWDALEGEKFEEHRADYDPGWDNHLNVWVELAEGRSTQSWMDRNPHRTC